MKRLILLLLILIIVGILLLQSAFWTFDPGEYVNSALWDKASTDGLNIDMPYLDGKFGRAPEAFN